ncbi:hypothetical protein F4802DRAFT_585046 [Xylaria palmicola]|nr:hypothetical protein F4802DRAFT_585046 [Xylaria palmicola]
MKIGRFCLGYPEAWQWFYALVTHIRNLITVVLLHLHVVQTGSLSRPIISGECADVCAVRFHHPGPNWEISQGAISMSAVVKRLEAA